MLDLTKLKTTTDSKIHATKTSIFVFYKVEDMAEQGENAGHQCFLLFHNVYKSHVH